jgi:hypothetical protein
MPISGAQGTTKASTLKTSSEQVVARPLIGWLAMYLSMEVPISAAGRTWHAFCPLSNITISMPKWSLQARKTPLQTGELHLNSPISFGPIPFGRSGDPVRARVGFGSHTWLHQE